MHRLLATTSLSAFAMFGSAPAFAQVKIEAPRTTPVATSTADNGARADVEITAAGSITLTAGTAVTLDSANKVANAGTLKVTDASDATGVLVTPAGSGTITNSGSIVIDETYETKDTDGDGDPDGSFAAGARRFGIRTADGAAFVGSITNSGAITIEGNESGAIRLGGALQGSLTSSGEIKVTGDATTGIRTGAVSGDVRISGGIAVQGRDAVGIAIDGPVGGALVLQGAVATTGYRYTTAPADVSKLDADDLLQGGPAVRITAGVAGGILLDAPPVDSDPAKPDEDNDGIPDAQETTAALTSYGAAPALEIGAAQNISVGAVAGDAGGHGLVIRGKVGADGVYAGIDAVGVALGGKGGTVTLANGIAVSGAVASVGRANSTALRLGAGTALGDIAVGGSILAQGGADAAHHTRAIAILEGASLLKLTNSGTIGAAALDAGTATAIQDASGTLALVENSGAIKAASGATGRAVALDLRQNTSGATVRQLGVASTATAPSIVGEVLFGSGNDRFEIADGSVAGTVDFGNGNNAMALSGDATHSGLVRFGGGGDQLNLTGTARLIGDVDFGGGGDTLALASGTLLRGRLSNSGALVANISGTLDATGAVALGGLNVGATGVIGVTIAGGTGAATQYQVGGTATFAAGSKMLVQLTSVSAAIGNYTVVKAGGLSGAQNLALTGTDLPFLFKGSLAVDQAAGAINLTIARKSADELQLNGSQANAYDAIFAVLDKDSRIAQTFLAITDAETIGRRFGSFLPDHAGGAFESATQASRAAARIVQDPLVGGNDRAWSLWAQQVAWGTSKSLGNTAAYDVSGWGFNAGAERLLAGFGRVGASLGVFLGLDDNGANDNSVQTAQYEAAFHWRARFGGLGLFARASAATIDFDSERRFDGGGNDSFARVAAGTWRGTLYSASGGASYEARVGGRLALRPAVVADYYRLSETGYSESGGGDAFDLTVDRRTSDESAVTGTMSLAYDLGSLDPQQSWLRVEAEGGWRTIIGGALGATTARFGTGDAFTLYPEGREDGWIGRLRLAGGHDAFTIGGEVSAEDQQGHVELAARLSLQMGW